MTVKLPFIIHFAYKSLELKNCRLPIVQLDYLRHFIRFRFNFHVIIVYSIISNRFLFCFCFLAERSPFSSCNQNHCCNTNPTTPHTLRRLFGSFFFSFLFFHLFHFPLTLLFKANMYNVQRCKLFIPGHMQA